MDPQPATTAFMRSSASGRPRLPLRHAPEAMSEIDDLVKEPPEAQLPVGRFRRARRLTEHPADRPGGISEAGKGSRRYEARETCVQFEQARPLGDPAYLHIHASERIRGASDRERVLGDVRRVVDGRIPRQSHAPPELPTERDDPLQVTITVDADGMLDRRVEVCLDDAVG